MFYEKKKKKKYYYGESRTRHMTHEVNALPTAPRQQATKS